MKRQTLKDPQLPTTGTTIQRYHEIEKYMLLLVSSVRPPLLGRLLLPLSCCVPSAAALSCIVIAVRL